MSPADHQRIAAKLRREAIALTKRACAHEDAARAVTAAQRAAAGERLAAAMCEYQRAANNL